MVSLSIALQGHLCSSTCQVIFADCVSFLKFLGMLWYEKGYMHSACLFFAKIDMQTLKGAEEWKGLLYKHNFHLHWFSIVPNCPEDAKECCMFKGFQHF